MFNKYSNFSWIFLPIVMLYMLSESKAFPQLEKFHENRASDLDKLNAWSSSDKTEIGILKPDTNQNIKMFFSSNETAQNRVNFKNNEFKKRTKRSHMNFTTAVRNKGFNRIYPPPFQNALSKKDSSIYRGKRESDIYFPGEPMEPQCAKGSTFCTEVENYPEALVESILSRESKKYQELFGADLVTPEEITNRFNNDIEEETLCSSSEVLIYPKLGLTKDSTWMYIINQKNYTQGVRVEQCTHTNQCSMSSNFPIGYESRCKQKYIYRQLLALDNNGNTVKNVFQLPSCCQCVLTHTDRGKRSANEQSSAPNDSLSVN